MSREAMLERIKAALSHGAFDAADGARQVTTRHAQARRHPVPSFARLEGDQRLTRFTKCLEAQGAEVVLANNIDELPSAAAKLTEALGPRHSLVIGDDERLRCVGWPSAMAPKLWTRDQSLGDGTAAITHASGAVAETGTPVLTSGAAAPSSLAFLPELHIIVVARDTIAASFEDAFARLSADIGPTRWPRAINLVSGASRTGDIGGRIVKGAHGPRRLAVFIYGSG